MSRRHVDPLMSVYAEVLGEVAFERGGQALLVEVGEALTALGRAWAGQRQLRAFFLSALVKQEDKRVALARLLGDLPPLLSDFVHLLLRRGRGRIIDRVAVAYEEYLDRKLGRVPVALATAMPVSEDRIRAWSDRIRAATGKEPVMEHTVKPELIAGAVLQVGHALVDGSARRRLADYRERVRERGTHALQA